MNFVITAWSAISSFGLGREAFESGWRSGPDEPGYLASDFVIEEVLGKKGTSSMDRSSALAVGATGHLLSENPRVEVNSTTGVVLGTTSGSAQTQLDFTRDSLVRRKPYFVNPAAMPFALMNSAAAQCAIWHKLTGPNATIAAGRLSGLAVLRYASQLLGTGRASGVVCGAVEEYGAARAWLEHQRHGDQDDRVGLGEGAAVFFLEPADPGRPALAEVRGIRTRVAVDGDSRRALGICVRDVLDRSGVQPADVWAVARSGAGGPLARAEQDAIGDVFGGQLDVNPADVFGDVGAATGPFQLAALLSTPAPGACWAVQTALDDDGAVGCALLRLSGRS